MTPLEQAHDLALAHAEPVPGTDARARFLALVDDARQTVLPDNLDYLFAPFGVSLPRPEESDERLAAQLEVLERSQLLWSRLGDKDSRELLLRLLAYRALGAAHVRLRFDPLEYRRAVIQLSARTIERAGLVGVGQVPLEWQFHLYNLAAAGYPIRIVGQQLPIASTYLFSQYAYTRAEAAAAPRLGDVAVDAGGCWGETALWLAHKVGPQGRVHSFEPVPQNRTLLAKNLEFNPQLAPRIRVWDAPLGARQGERLWIRDTMAAGAQAAADPGSADGAPSVEVHTEAIDTLVASGELERVDFLKVDVEGADLAVLEGAAETIAAQRPRLAIAIYHRPDDFATIPDFVASLGVDYRWYLQCSTMTDADTVAFAVPA